MRRLAVILIIALAAVATGCEEDKSGASRQQKREASYTAKVQETVRARIGWPQVEDSLELRNLKKRYETLDDQNKIGYVYLIAHGLIVANYTVKGKVSSLDSQFTNPDQVIKSDFGEGWEASIVAQAEPDGSYGDNPEGIFFWDTKGVYHEWSGDYLYTDQRMTLRQPPQLQVEAQAGG